MKIIVWLPLASTLVFFIGCGSSEPSPTEISEERAFLSLPPTDWIMLGETFLYQSALEGEGETAYKLEKHPAGMTIDAQTGLITWNTDQAGDHAIALTATVAATSYRQTFSLRVSAAESPEHKTIGPGGGELTAGALELKVPAGAIGEDLDFSVATLSHEPVIDSSAQIRTTSPIYAISSNRVSDGESVQRFETPINITLAYNPADLPAWGDETRLLAALIDPAISEYIIPAETSIDNIAHSVSFQTNHLSNYSTVLLVPETEIAGRWKMISYDDRFSCEFDSEIDLSESAMLEYCAESIRAAHQVEIYVRDNLKMNISTKNRLAIRILDATGSSYSYWFGTIYAKYSPNKNTTSRNREILRAVAHEYFHAVQDEYYSMTMLYFRDYYWWSEASAPWLANLLSPGVIKGTISSAPEGYLREPLNKGNLYSAYAKSTFVAYAEEAVDGFVKKILDAHSGISGSELISTIDALLPLKTHYPAYLADSIIKYGQGSVIDGWVYAAKWNEGYVIDKFDFNGTKQQNATALSQYAQTAYSEISFTDSPKGSRYRGLIYKIEAISGSSNIALQLTFSGPNRGGDSVPRVVTFDNSKNFVAQYPLADGQALNIKPFGLGSNDQVGSVYLVYADTLGQPSATPFNWTIRLQDASTQVVSFPDPNLEQAIREVIGKPAGEILATDLENMPTNTLSANLKGISDLTGLQYCINLNHIRLSANDIVDISSLTKLDKLATLEIDGNEIAELPDMSGMTNLRSIDLSSNAITDITPLASITTLEQIDISSNLLTTLADLSHLTQLNSLDASANQITGLSGISGLPALGRLELDRNQISDISPLQNLDELWYLYLYGNHIQDISALSNLPKLSWLHLGNNQIQSIAPLLTQVQTHHNPGTLFLYKNCLNPNCYIINGDTTDCDQVESILSTLETYYADTAISVVLDWSEQKKVCE